MGREKLKSFSPGCSQVKIYILFKQLNVLQHFFSLPQSYFSFNMCLQLQRVEALKEFLQKQKLV